MPRMVAHAAEFTRGTTRTFAVSGYDLGATLNCGQAFRWEMDERGWVGVIGGRWVRLGQEQFGLTAETAEPISDWGWLIDYLQLDLDLNEVLRTFPNDPPMQAAMEACRGLRLLRQDPWECVASFILSSTKRIVQIRQIISRLCECYGEPATVAPGQGCAWTFPTASALAKATEAGLRACKMGFRAPYLLASARAIAGGEVDLGRLHQLPVADARAELLKLPGVGRKIADCALLFAYGFQSAFPVDVWVMKGLREYYFGGRQVSVERLHRFAAKHFGPNAGHAQQYLFHYMRTRASGIEASAR